jgi:hypothetical protein
MAGSQRGGKAANFWRNKMHYKTAKSLAEMVRKATNCADELEKMYGQSHDDVDNFREAAMMFEEELKRYDNPGFLMYENRMQEA